jgi:hypothetical protein
VINTVTGLSVAMVQTDHETYIIAASALKEKRARLSEEGTIGWRLSQHTKKNSVQGACRVLLPLNQSPCSRLVWLSAHRIFSGKAVLGLLLLSSGTEYAAEMDPSLGGIRHGNRSVQRRYLQDALTGPGGPLCAARTAAETFQEVADLQAPPRRSVRISRLETHSRRAPTARI